MSTESDAALVAALFAVDPFGLSGVCLRAQVHELRQPWLDLLHRLLPEGGVRRIPFNIGDGRLLGELNLQATLAAHRPVLERGVLAASDGGVVVIAMAEQLSSHTAAILCAALDRGEVSVNRDAVAATLAARIGIVALDEGIEEAGTPAPLLDRFAFLVDFEAVSRKARLASPYASRDIASARELLKQVRISDELVQRLCGTALALGIESPRAAWSACRTALAAAALCGRTEVHEEDAVLAGRLVLAPRARGVPSQASQVSQPSQNSQSESEDADSTKPDRPEQEQQESRLTSTDSNALNDPNNDPDNDPGQAPDVILSAARAAIPPGLLARLQSASAKASARARQAGRFGAERRGVGRGRPAGVRAGSPRQNARLNVLETLRASAPWQRVRGRELSGDARLRILASDFRLTLSKQRSRTLTVFAVDASGSAALHRLAEAKGAVELLLADCYLRRDSVAVIAFRGKSAELVLPPTRSLVRAKRSLAGVPGGGATPLAAALHTSQSVAEAARRRGDTVTLVVLSDGRANVCRDGTAGREAAHHDALASAQALRALGFQALFVDTSPRPNALAQSIATAMRARYVPLPYASSRMLTDIVRSTASQA